MSEPHSFEEISEMARRMKLDVVHQYGDDPDESRSDLPNVVSVFRDGQPAVLVFPSGTPESVRQSIYWAAALMRADALYLVADARFKEMPEGTSEDEARRRADEHKAGDFQRDWEAGRRDGLTEALVVERIPAMGPPEMVSYPYLRQGRKLTWLAPHGLGHDIGGAVPDYARQGFNDARTKTAEMLQIAEEMAGWFDIPLEDRSHHLDRVLARFVTTKVGVDRVVLLADLSEFKNGEPL